MTYFKYYGAKAYPWPAPREVVERMLAAKSPLAEMAELSVAECKERLRAHWAALTFPANQAIAKLILSHPSMCIIEGGDDGFRLGLYSKQPVMSMVAMEHNTPPAQLKFPFAAIPGLLEFLRYFSGLMDFGNFVTSSSLRIMWNADKKCCWGPVDNWDGSLVIYQIMSANVLVIRPDGAIGKWDHEFAAPIPLAEHRKEYKQYGFKDGPVIRLKYDFAGLLKKYVQYCQRNVDAGRPEENIFYS